MSMQTRYWDSTQPSDGHAGESSTRKGGPTVRWAPAIAIDGAVSILPWAWPRLHAAEPPDGTARSALASLRIAPSAKKTGLKSMSAKALGA